MYKKCDLIYVGLGFRHPRDEEGVLGMDPPQIKVLEVSGYNPYYMAPT